MVFGGGAAHTLGREITATGIRARRIAPGASLEATAYKPDGAGYLTFGWFFVAQFTDPGIDLISAAGEGAQNG